jgi:hypothetical protein
MKSLLIAFALMGVAAFPAAAQVGEKYSKPTYGKTTILDFLNMPQTLGGVPIVTRSDANVDGDATLLDATIEETDVGSLIKFGVGNTISFCPELSCPQPPNAKDYGHHRTSALFSAVTQFDGIAEENTVTIHTEAVTGEFQTWAPTTAYTLGDNILRTDANSTYRLITAGTSGATDPFNKYPDGSVVWKRSTGGSGSWAASTAYSVGDKVVAFPSFQTYEVVTAGTSGATTPFNPTNLFRDITDGTNVWKWINVGKVHAKVGLYNELQAQPGGGKVWAQANNLDLAPGYDLNILAINTELDYTNRSGTNCGFLSGKTCPNLFLVHQGDYQGSAGIQVTAPQATAASGVTSGARTVWGAIFQGQYLYEKAGVEIDGAGEIGLGINAYGLATGNPSIAAVKDGTSAPRSYYNTGSHSVATIHDAASGSTPNTLLAAGNRSGPMILDNTASTTSYTAGGTKSVAGVAINSVAPTGLLLGGTFATYQVLGQNGFSVTSSGVVTAPAVRYAPQTVASLPGCVSGIAGELRAVNDSGSPTYRGVVAGGGVFTSLVFCTGGAWVYH